MGAGKDRIASYVPHERGGRNREDSSHEAFCDLDCGAWPSRSRHPVRGNRQGGAVCRSRRSHRRVEQRSVSRRNRPILAGGGEPNRAGAQSEIPGAPEPRSGPRRVGSPPGGGGAVSHVGDGGGRLAAPHCHRRHSASRSGQSGRASHRCASLVGTPCDHSRSGSDRGIRFRHLVRATVVRPWEVALEVGASAVVVGGGAYSGSQADSGPGERGGLHTNPGANCEACRRQSLFPRNADFRLACSPWSVSGGVGGSRGSDGHQMATA